MFSAYLCRARMKILSCSGEMREVASYTFAFDPGPIQDALQGVLFAGFSLLNVRFKAITPAATFKPFCPSIEIGCSAIELLKPPTRTLAPAPTPTAALAVAPP